MTPDPLSTIHRREFLKAAGAVTVLSLTQPTFAQAGGKRPFSIDANDPVRPARLSSGPLSACRKRSPEKAQRAFLCNRRKRSKDRVLAL